MSEALIPADLIVNVTSKELVADATRSSEYLPSLRIFDGSSKRVKSGDIPAGEIAIITSDETIELGKETIVLNCGYRLRAAVFQGDQPPVSYYDPETTEFQEVKALALAKTRNYQYGLEYLVWVPAAGMFAVLYLGNPSGRRISGTVEALVGRAVRLTSQFVEKGEHSWHAFKAEEATTPVTPPEREDLEKAVQLFTAPVTPATGRDR